MAPKPINYSNTIIYKLEHEDNKTLFYVGSTTDFIQRKACHKHRCNNPNGKLYNSKVYKMIRENGGWECFKMVEITKYPCNDANEAYAEEERFRELLNPDMNSKRAYTGLSRQDYDKQWRDDNPDYDKNYRIKNADKIRKRISQKITCGCGAVVCKNNLARHKRSGIHFRWEQNNIE